MLDSYVALDLEMTGLNVRRDRILEIGAVRVVSHKTTALFQCFVNPHRKLTKQVEALTGISSKMLEGAKEDKEALLKLIEFCGELPLLGHNIIFDYGFLKQCAVNYDINYQKQAVDTLKIARKCLPQLESKRLEYLGRYYGLCSKQRHRALSDAGLTADLFEILQEEYAERYPELFVPRPLQYKAKKQGPLTPAQKRDLMDLISYHKISTDIEIESLTRSEASRMIDQILSACGRRREGREHV